MEVETLFGTLQARFPDLITQYMPFSNMVAMRHDLDAVHETIVGFEGDVFETEDQRAFTDASYKTFSRPLEMPRPYKVEAGTLVRQVVTVRHPRLVEQGPRVVGGTGGRSRTACGAPGRSRSGHQPCPPSAPACPRTT